MYETKIKDKYLEGIQSFWWNDSGKNEYKVIMTMGNMSLLYCEETNLILDIFNNKIETFKKIPEGSLKIFVEAKNMEYADRFNIHGEFEVVGFVDRDGPVLLKIIGKDMFNIQFILPSRLRVNRIEKV